MAKMKEQERIEYERQKAQEESAETQAKLDAYLLKDEATKLAETEGLPVGLLDLYDFRHVSKDEMPEQVKKAATAFKEAVKAEVLVRTENKVPEQHTTGGGETPKTAPTMF